MLKVNVKFIIISKSDFTARTPNHTMFSTNVKPCKTLKSFVHETNHCMRLKLYPTEALLPTPSHMTCTPIHINDRSLLCRLLPDEHRHLLTPGDGCRNTINTSIILSGVNKPTFAFCVQHAWFSNVSTNNSPAGPTLITCPDVWILMIFFFFFLPLRSYDGEFGFD